MATRRRANVGVQIGHSVAPTIRPATCRRYVAGGIRLCGPRDLGEVVSPITGVRRAEPVPDAFERTGEITLVDFAPSALRHRLAQSLVVPGQVGGCSSVELFRFANLAALREFAQLWLDDCVPDSVAAFLPPAASAGR